MRMKLQSNDYDLEQIEQKFYNNDELSDVVSKCNKIDQDDKHDLLPRLSNFDKMVKERISKIGTKKKEINYS